MSEVPHMKLRKRVRRLERRIDALTGKLPDNAGVPTEPLDPHRLWDEQIARYSHYGEDDADEWNLRGYL